jgi:low affinity Fe/Cu permease
MNKTPDQRATPPEQDESLLYRIGCLISEYVSDLAAHPYTQAGVIIFCIAWFAFGLATDLLTAALSILAISLSQMVLNRQNVREAEAHRRDVAMHAKLDELLIASRRARNEMAGIEEILTEDEIAEIKPHNGDDLRQAADDPRTAHRRMPFNRQKARPAR